MEFGIYVHIPYCLQRCRYCDFTTFELRQAPPFSKYLELILTEIRNRSHWFQPGPLTSLYFGGGTPSLIPADHIVSIIQELANAGFVLNSSTEATIEINPATMDQEKFQTYLEHGINRFSVGGQTFDDRLLKLCGRRHTAQDTCQTLDILISHQTNYSFDLLFALPGQNMDQLERDLAEVMAFNPPHLSAYCLTVPAGHPMASGRPPEGHQVEMFHRIQDKLLESGLKKYEISNFSQEGRESKHNLLYWTDQPYWGIGLSAHSFLHNSAYGTRFWNPSHLKEYERQVQAPELPENQREELSLNEALTDYCHTSLRRSQGLIFQSLKEKFGPMTFDLVQARSEKALSLGLLDKNTSSWRLTRKGEQLSNQVFLDFTFLKTDIDPLTNSSRGSYLLL